MKNFKQVLNKHIHFIGIGGISMSGLATIVINKGGIVSGSDITLNQETDRLSDNGAIIFLGHNINNITADIDLVVHTSAVGKDNPELVRAKELGIPIMERAEFLGLVACNYTRVIAVAGTHGKTTTTAILSEIFTHAGFNPTVHIGGESIGLKGNTIIGGDRYFIVEACEYKESFRYLNPFIGIITNIEADHLDYYKDYSEIRKAFLRFASRSENVISLKDDNIKHNNVQTIFGDWSVKNIEFFGNGYNFNVYYKGKYWHTFRINLLGEHNITNSLFAIATAHYCGISKETIEQALSNFQGVERRYERIHTFTNGCRVIIDYAHHPTELKASIRGLKGVFQRILYVFQPHTYSRTLGLFDEFLAVLNTLPNVVIFATYPAREKIIVGGTAMDLYSSTKNKNKYYFDDIDELKQFMNEQSSQFDCILVLGAGDLADKLKRNYINAENINKSLDKSDKVI